MVLFTYINIIYFSSATLIYLFILVFMKRKRSTTNNIIINKSFSEIDEDFLKKENNSKNVTIICHNCSRKINNQVCYLAYDKFFCSKYCQQSIIKNYSNI